MSTPTTLRAHAGTAEQTLELGATLRAAAFNDLEAAADGKEKVPTFRLVAYDGKPMRPAGWPGGVVVDVARSRVRAGKTPILFGHDQNRALGMGTVELDASTGEIAVEGALTGAGPDRENVIAAARRGHEWQASIGAAVIHAERVPEGETRRVNGRDHKGPVYVAAVEIAEVSIVAIGAASTTRVRIAAKHTRGSSMEFHDWLRARGFDPATLTEQQEETLRASWQSDGGTVTATLDDGREAAARELERRAEIERICAGAPKVAANAIRSGWSPEKAELEMYRVRAAAGDPPGGGPMAGRGGRSPGTAAITAALAMTAGVSEDRLAADREIGERAVEEARRIMGSSGCGLRRGFELAAQAAGLHLSRDELATDGGIRAAMGSHQLTETLGNAANKRLLASFEAVPQHWRELAFIDRLPDFKERAYLQVAVGDKKEESYAKVGEDGQLKALRAVETGFTLQASTYGATFGVTRQTIINDDLGALMNPASMFGREAGHRLNQVIFAHINANTDSFFHANNGNLRTGAGSAFDKAGLAAGVRAFREQTAKNGALVEVEPSRLPVPPALEEAANELFSSTFLVVGDANGTAGAANVHMRKYRPVVSAHLGSKGPAGGSDTAWYLWADPAVVPALVVGFLNGRQVPTVRAATMPPGYLGMIWESFIDFGVGWGDPRGAQKNTGA